MNKKALIVVDYQNDFIDPNGTLYVPEAEKLYKKIAALIVEFQHNGDLVIATKDFHPNNHCSFTKWGPHCIANTFGSEFYKLTTTQFDHIILKGTQQDVIVTVVFLVIIKLQMDCMNFFKSTGLLI